MAEKKEATKAVATKEKDTKVADTVMTVANELAEDRNEAIGLDEKADVKYLKDNGSFKKGATRKMGIFKAKTFQKLGIVKVI